MSAEGPPENNQILSPARKHQKARCPWWTLSWSRLATMNDVDNSLEGPASATQVARRADQQRRQIFSHKGARVAFFLALFGLIVTVAFAIMPDDRTSGTLVYSSRFGGAASR